MDNKNPDAHRKRRIRSSRSKRKNLRHRRPKQQHQPGCQSRIRPNCKFMENQDPPANSKKRLRSCLVSRQNLRDWRNRRRNNRPSFRIHRSSGSLRPRNRHVGNQDTYAYAASGFACKRCKRQNLPYRRKRTMGRRTVVSRTGRKRSLRPSKRLLDHRVAHADPRFRIRLRSGWRQNLRVRWRTPTKNRI